MQTIYERIPNIDDQPGRNLANFPALNDQAFGELYERCKKYSMLQVAGFYNLYRSIRYVSQRNVPGEFVECGILLGGASMFAALALDHFGLGDRKLYLYDTFNGFPAGQVDVVQGKAVPGPRFKPFKRHVVDNFNAEQVDLRRVTMIEGDVEKTLLTGPTPGTISILRLDTNFYASTKSEMEILYPKLAQHGVLIVDGYGSYEGCRRAIDEYLGYAILLNRIDPGISSGIKV